MQSIIDISISPVHIGVDTGLLKIQNKQTGHISTVCFDDILCILVSSKAATLTHRALSELASFNIPYVALDSKMMPVGIMLPYAAHCLQSERMRQQIAFNFKEKVWASIVLGKIKNSIFVLNWWGLKSSQLEKLEFDLENIPKNLENIEAIAAKLYFEELFETGFTRRDSGHPENSRLNYGYTLIRACVSRFICASGLHPTFGLYHKNRYNSFSLADDLMEPFRPYIDHMVMSLLQSGSLDIEFSPNEKKLFIASMFEKMDLNGESRPLTDVIKGFVQSFARCITNNTGEVSVPLFQSLPFQAFEND